ncbi:MAG: hypothetical protein HDS29_00370 [Bacteroides sp.]|nr:hypothetical protein [Bacteroides sp.]
MSKGNPILRQTYIRKRFASFRLMNLDNSPLSKECSQMLPLGCCVYAFIHKSQECEPAYSHLYSWLSRAYQADDAISAHTFFICLLVFHHYIVFSAEKRPYHPMTTRTSSRLYALSRRYCGAASPLTTYILGRIIGISMRKAGLGITQINTEHLLGNSYYGVANANGKQIHLSINADTAGNITCRTASLK